MEPGPLPSLQMPSFLHGLFPAVNRKTLAEGQRCGEQYRKDGSFPPPREMREVPPGEVVLAHEVVDFQRERPAWRLYLTSKVLSGLCEALDWQNAFQVSAHYEKFCRETAWGALYFAISQDAPRSTERTALRLQAVLRFWEPLQSVRYLFSTPNIPLTLEELMVASHDWAMDAWCPVGEASVHTRLEKAAERMVRATREDCIEAILREMPRALAHAQGLKHRDVLSRPDLLRQRFATLKHESFERVSAACTADLLAQLYAWDRQIEKQ
jgi:hypothetical protein